MGRVQRLRDLNRQRQERFHLHRPARDLVIQGFSIQEFHCDKALVAVPANLVNSADVWMVQGRGSPRFPAETLQSLRVLRDLQRQKLQRNETTELGIFSLIDNSHPATAKFLDDAVMGYGLPDHRAQILGL
jgi:hypothetical protein